jgi:transcriptional regulator
VFIAPADATRGEDEWRSFVTSYPFGHLVAPGGPGRDLPVVVPTQFVLEERTVWLHLVRANPIFTALAENPRVLLSVAGDWAFIPSSWKAIGDEDPALGIQPGLPVADPGESHAAKLLGILGIEISVEQVSAKFKYGGNVDEAHRSAVVEHLQERGAPGDNAAAEHVLRRLDVTPL